MTTRADVLTHVGNDFPINAHIAQAEPVNIFHHAALRYIIKSAIGKLHVGHVRFAQSLQIERVFALAAS